MFKYFLLCGRYDRQGPTALDQRCAARDMTDCVSCMQTFILSFLSFCFGRFGPKWSVLWHVPVDAHRVEGATRFLMQLYQSEVSAPQTITYESTWTPMKRLAVVVEQTPEETTMAEDGA